MPKIIEYPDELTHYGRLGMKWGQHIFTDDDIRNKESPRKAAKALNSLERKRVKYNANTHLWNRQNVKIAKRRLDRTPSSSKKYAARKQKYESAISKYTYSSKQAEKLKSDVNKLAQKLIKSGNYNVYEKEAAHVVYSGKAFVTLMRQNFVDFVPLNFTTTGAANTFAGYYYKVKSKGG